MNLRWSVLAFLPLVAAVALGACSEDDEGGLGVDAPCTANDQCASGLVCDTHGGSDGTCQEPHAHTTGSSSSTGGSGATGGAGGSATGGTGGAASASGGAGGSGGSADTPCQTYCSCLQDSCSSFEGYPHADEGACLTACGGYTEEELGCWTSFCFQAARATGAKDHLCEHAWGADGLAECP